jgi:1-pyrroline-5-carboxylate dehydrogenase
MSLSAWPVSGSQSAPPPTSAIDLAPGADGRARLDQALNDVYNAGFDIPSVIAGEELRTGDTAPIVVPHDHGMHLGLVHQVGKDDVVRAIEAATSAWKDWSRQPLDVRAQPFVRAADMLEFGPWRERMTAAAMLELSKTPDQADGDAAAEAVDFLRANLHNALQMATIQPSMPAGVTNHLDYRPLEGFILAITPFNFVSMNNLALGPALLGNCVVWKPAETASLAAHLTMELLTEAGLPAGVINLVHGDGATVGDVALRHRDLAGVAFTGSTGTFRHIWRTVGENIDRYRNYPRVLGETGGKDFVLAHESADVQALATASVRGAFEYAGQKCAAASRMYVPRSLWPQVRDEMVAQTEGLVVGDPTDPKTYVGAVISARQFAKHEAALARARAEDLVITGGDTNGSKGWFVDPTILEVQDPQSFFMTEELFAPILATYVYEDGDWERTLGLVDGTSEYGLTGSVFATDEAAIAEADLALRYTAGNFYINDKPSGATVGQQPFGGARASGTNDKAGTVWSSIRFVSPRAVKRTHQPVRDYRYPHQF